MRILFMALCLISTSVFANSLHPGVPLLDQSGNKVIDSGMPMSTLKSCGACHDTGYIQAHSDHADAGASQSGSNNKVFPWAAGAGFYGSWNVFDYDQSQNKQGGIDNKAWLQRYGSRYVGGGPVADYVEMNCLLCHTDTIDPEIRRSLLETASFQWVNSVSLIKTGALDNLAGEWRWNKEFFDQNGALAADALPIYKPKDQNCGQCHGLLYTSIESPLVLGNASDQLRTTLFTGQIFSAQKLNSTGMNLADKSQLTRPLDIHSDRVLNCVNCHYSLNNPVYYQRHDESQPEHLSFDPRRITLSEYLEKPLHQFAKGASSHGLASVTDNSLRRCESCHEAASTHEWLPYKARHFSEVACESCHIPKLYGPTIQSVDWTLPDPEGKPIIEYRNSGTNISASNNLISGYQPVLLPRSNVGSRQKLAPYNLITGWIWLAGDPEKPVDKKILVEAFSEGGTYKTSLLEVFDTDKDGALSTRERQLDTDEKIARLKTMLEDAGAPSARLYGSVSAYAISHNVVNGEWATRDCQSCHHEQSRVDGELLLSSYQPKGIMPEFAANQGVDFSGDIISQDDGSLKFQADANRAGVYVFGLHNVPIVDWIGLLMFFGITLGVSAHAIARKIANRKLGHVQHQYKREYMYDAYERLWHWMQAGSIIILLFTGLVIHKPHIFGIFSFAYMVEVHNVVGFILLVNAALALFYNLASGEIRQYLPEPKGFIGRSVAQAMYYSKGIFEGAEHPVEKSHEHKMNPLQQVTYLAILNLLLPAQVITGLLIWGAQRWPHIADSLGGLAFLAPAHTLIAWAFATFIVMHVYLTTTGHTPLAGIKSMIEGYDEVEVPDGKTNA